MLDSWEQHATARSKWELHFSLKFTLLLSHLNVGHGVSWKGKEWQISHPKCPQRRKREPPPSVHFCIFCALATHRGICRSHDPIPRCHPHPRFPDVWLPTSRQKQIEHLNELFYGLKILIHGRPYAHSTPFPQQEHFCPLRRYFFPFNVGQFNEDAAFTKYVPSHSGKNIVWLKFIIKTIRTFRLGSIG